jgi:hypothetical protein
MSRDPYPWEVWQPYMDELNKEQALLGKRPWITKRKPNTQDLSRIFLALGADNDPYWSGRHAERPLGEWFAEIHKRRIGNERRHIRGCFYIASGEDPDPEGNEEPERWPQEGIWKDGKEVGLPPALKGALVDKTDSLHWDTFQQASKFARNMGLVNPSLITDSVTPVDRFFHGPGSIDPWLDYESPSLVLPDSVSSLPPSFTEATASVHGYRLPDMVPSLCEIWIEKELDSEDRPVVRSVARQMGVNVITGRGNFRISQAYAVLRRQEEAGGIPLRILFLSDFDSAGDHIPVSPARHMQFALEGRDPKPDVRLFHLALTEEQVREQNIPTKPPTTAAEEQAAKDRYFNARTGNLGAVQLNALTDTGPRAEWFEGLLREAIEALRDPNLTEKWLATRNEARELVDEELERLMRWPHRGLQLIAERYQETAQAGFETERQAIADKTAEIMRLQRERRALEDDLRQKQAAEIDPLRERANAILRLARQRVERLEDLELPTFEAEEPPEAAEGWLFDSRREMEEQALHYNARKFGTPIEVDDEDDDLADDGLVDDFDW